MTASAASFEEVAQPRPGYGVVSELAVYQDRLFAVLNAGPLGTPGVAIFESGDGHHWVSTLEIPDSEGILRLRVARGRLFAPEADPPGQQRGRIWQIGTEAPRAVPIAGVAHTYDLVEFEGLLVTAGGGSDFRGVLHRSDDGIRWTRAASVPAQRLRLLVSFAKRIFVSKTRGQARSDYLTWRPGEAPLPVDAVPGEAHTWCWYVTSGGQLLWSHSTRGERGQVRSTGDGEQWERVAGLGGQVVWDFAELEGVIFALAERGLFASSGGAPFRRVAAPPTADTFAPVPEGDAASSESSASLVAWRGRLFAGALREGRIYRIDVSTVLP